MVTVTRRGLALAVAALAPWSWFVVRDVHPWLDAVALAWPVLGAAVVAVIALVAIVRSSGRLALVTASWLVATAVVVGGPWRPLDTGEPVEDLRIAAVNIFGTNTYPPGVADEVGAQRPDVVVVSEVSDDAMTVFERAFGDHVRADGQRGEELGDVAVFSELPMRASPLTGGLAGQRGLRVEVEGPAGPFVLYALHLQKPAFRPSIEAEVGFRTHRRLIDALVDAAAAEELPVVVAGDLNLVDRTGGYRALAGVLDDGLRSGWVGPTSLKRTTKLLLARIDHVFVPEDWCAADGKTFTMRGSDHRGVAATVGPCR